MNMTQIIEYKMAAKKCKEFLSQIIATSFFVGKIPYAPGSFGSIVGLLLYCLLPNQYIVFTTFVLFVSGVIASSYYEKMTNMEDPKEVVIDEVVGQMLTLHLCLYKNNFGIYSYIASFLLFRFFDILKPWPIRLADRGLHGGIGIMFDDILAAIFAAFVYIVLS